MSEFSNMGFLEEESNSAGSSGSQETQCSLSRCDSSGSIASNTMQAHKSMEGSTSVETAWTDSKHSSYLDFMEANFVQNMFARCYCVEDVCGEMAHHDCHHQHHHHHRQQHQSQTDFDEDDYNSAQSGLRSPETLEYTMYNHGDWTRSTVMKSKAAAGTPRALLVIPWVQHFRPERPSSVGSRAQIPPLRNKGSKRNAHNLATTSPLTNIPDQHQEASNISGIVYSQAGRRKDFMSNFCRNAAADRRALRKKRRILWSTYEQICKSRQRIDNYVLDGMTFNQDEAAPLEPIVDSVSEGNRLQPHI